MLFWIISFLILLSLSKDSQLRTLWHDLPCSEYEQIPKFWETTDGLKGIIAMFDRTWIENERLTL